MPGVEDQSTEFGGRGVMPNTVFPRDVLSNGDRLRLQSITGQEEDSRAPVDPAFWQGATVADDTQAKKDARARQRQQQLIARQDRQRYRESR